MKRESPIVNWRFVWFQACVRVQEIMTATYRRLILQQYQQGTALKGNNAIQKANEQSMFQLQTAH